MIYSLLVDDPKSTPAPVAHWSEVPWLKKVGRIDFKPGLNIIFGQNGSGKSTVITALATLLHCRQTNWPVVTKQSCGDFLRSSGRLGNGLTLEHDGQPCRYLGIADMDAIPENRVVKIALSLKEHGKHVGRGYHEMSAGQKSVVRLMRFLRHDAKKTGFRLKSSAVTPDFQPIYSAAVEAVKNPKPQRGTPKQQVILLDEVDLSLDFAHQAAVWSQLRQLIAGGQHQVIIASHSPFAVNVPGAHYIETSEGYLDASRKALKILLDDAVEQQNQPRKRLAIS